MSVASRWVPGVRFIKFLSYARRDHYLAELEEGLVRFFDREADLPGGELRFDNHHQARPIPTAS